MKFIDVALEPPSYGWQDVKGNVIKPTVGQILKEFLSRINIFKTKKNWIPFTNWLQVAILMPVFFLFLFKYLTVGHFIIGFVYSMILMGTHGTIWHHRYCTHGAYEFKNKFWRFVTQNLTVKVIIEENYVISHHVHHAKSDMPGDPYNANCGFLYCFLADTNHQPIGRSMSKENYGRAVNLMRHTGIKANTYEQYQKWGSIAHPLLTTLQWMLNWVFWYSVFYCIGGNGLSVTIFAAAFFWAAGVRTFNYEGHGKGKDKRVDGIDYNREDMSINQVWPGYVAGEWHNNHHLYPKSARTGFLPYQIDFAFYYIKFLSIIGAVSTYRDDKQDFLENYRKPGLEAKVRQSAMIVNREPESAIEDI